MKKSILLFITLVSLAWSATLQEHVLGKEFEVGTDQYFYFEMNGYFSSKNTDGTYEGVWVAGTNEINISTPERDYTLTATIAGESIATTDSFSFLGKTYSITKITPFDTLTHTYTFNSGWNTFSLPSKMVLNDSQISTVFGNSAIAYLSKYSGGTWAYWVNNFQTNGAPYDRFTSITSQEGLYAKALSDSDLTISYNHNPRFDTEVKALNNEWTFVGFNTNASNIDTFLASLSQEEYSLLSAWVYKEGMWYVYDNNPTANLNLLTEVPRFTSVALGEGFWLKSKKAITAPEAVVDRAVTINEVQLDKYVGLLEKSNVSVEGIVKNIDINSTITIDFTGSSDSTTATTIVLEDGTWSTVADLSAFNDGEVKLVASTGSYSHTVNDAFVIDTLAQIFIDSFTLVVNDAIVSGSTNSVGLDRTVNITVVNNSNTKSYSATTNSTGAWSISIPLSDLQNGSVVISATTSDLAGNQATDSDSFTY
jgi:hypothetical protein